MPTLTKIAMKDNQYVYSLIHLENNKTITNIDNLNLNISTMQTIAPEQSQTPTSTPHITTETHIWLQIEGLEAVARTHALVARDRFELQSSIYSAYFY
jgi:hypothetical protein